MRDQTTCCDRCLRDFADADRDPYDPDRCVYCGDFAPSEEELTAMASYFGHLPIHQLTNEAPYVVQG